MKPLRYFYMNTAEILDKIFHIYKKTFFYQLLRILIIGSVSSILYFVCVFVFTAMFIGIVGLNFNSDFTPGLIAGISLAVILIILIYAFVAAINTSGSLSICRQAFYEKKPDISVTINESIKAAPKVFSVYLLLLVIYLPVVLISGFLIFHTGIFNFFGLNEGFFFDFDSIIAVVLFIAVLLLTMAAVTYIQTLTVCAAGCAVYEKLSFNKALKKSLLLTKGSRFKISLVLILWYAVNYAVSSSVSVVSAIPTFFTTVFNYSSSSSVFYMPVIMILEYVALIVVSLIMAPFSDIILSVIYFNQKIKKEGLDIIIELETESVG